MAEKRRGLGKGLGALMGDFSVADSEPHSASTLPVEYLQRGKYQPRKDMNSERLQELAESIKVQGIIQPILVREIAHQRYEIIAGERRWRAAQLAKLSNVPVIIKKLDDRATMAIALIENIQREDLNPLEEAEALQRLLHEFTLTHQQIAEAVGKSRAAITNLLRLNDLSSVVKQLVSQRELGVGHARALLSLAEREQLIVANKVVAEGLSVRKTESLVKALQLPANQVSKKTTAAVEKSYDRDTLRLQEVMTEFLGANTRINHKKSGQGSVVIRYSNLDELEGIVSRFDIKQRESF